MQKPSNPNAVWQIAVANGTYKVTLVMGDPSHTDQVNNVDIEGVVINDPLPQGTNGSWDNAAELTYRIDFSTTGMYNIWMQRYVTKWRDELNLCGAGR